MGNSGYLGSLLTRIDRRVGGAKAKVFEVLTLDGGGGTARGVEDGTLPLNIEEAVRREGDGQL